MTEVLSSPDAVVYSDGLVTLRHGDGLEFMQRTDSRFDLLMTDPPYFQEHAETFNALAAGAARVVAPRGTVIVYCGQWTMQDMLDAFARHGWRLAWVLALSTGRFRPAKRAWGIRQFWKPALWLWRDGQQRPLVDGMMRDWYEFPSSVWDEVKASGHPWAQPPLKEPIARLVDRATGCVLDPFAGSWSTLVAARAVGVRAVGVEIGANGVTQPSIACGRSRYSKRRGQDARRTASVARSRPDICAFRTRAYPARARREAGDLAALAGARDDGH